MPPAGSSGPADPALPLRSHSQTPLLALPPGERQGEREHLEHAERERAHFSNKGLMTVVLRLNELCQEVLTCREGGRTEPEKRTLSN